MQRSEFRPGNRHHFAGGIQFHGAGAQWNHGAVQRQIAVAQFPDVAQHLCFRAVAMENGMSEEHPKSAQVDTLFDSPELAEALDSGAFRRFLDQIPIAIVVAALKPAERIVYANPEFERISGVATDAIAGESWSELRGESIGAEPDLELGAGIVAKSDFVGTFKLRQPDGETATVDVYSNVIEDSDGSPRFRLAALIDVTNHQPERTAELEARIRDKHTLLREIQHRVKNNLQMIMALIRIEAHGVRDFMESGPLDRLAGRIEAIQIVYKLLSEHDGGDQIDLGAYISEIASSVMKAHAVEGIRLELMVDSYSISVNVALPTGLVVNELLTNALKHAFVGRDGGTITVHSLTDETSCRILVADDGIGMREGATWPAAGKLSALIVESLIENAKAKIDIQSAAGEGVRVTILFQRPVISPANA